MPPSLAGLIAFSEQGLASKVQNQQRSINSEQLIQIERPQQVTYEISAELLVLLGLLRPAHDLATNPIVRCDSDPKGKFAIPEQWAESITPLNAVFSADPSQELSMHAWHVMRHSEAGSLYKRNFILGAAEQHVLGRLRRGIWETSRVPSFHKQVRTIVTTYPNSCVH